jgi:hypothetical protein
MTGCGLLYSAGIAQPTSTSIRSVDSVIGCGCLGSFECSCQVGRHALAIVWMNEVAPLGRGDHTISGRQSEDTEELCRAVCHLIAEIPFERRHASCPLREHQHLLALTKDVCRITFAPLARRAFGDRRGEHQSRAGQHAHERLQQNQALMYFGTGKRSGPPRRVPD